MKSFVRNFLLGLWVTLFPTMPVMGQSHCKCRPSPPGGVTTCHRSGEIAVCGDNGRGICEGSCSSIKTGLLSLEFTAVALTRILEDEVSVMRLRSEAETFKPIIASILASSQNDEPVTINYKDKEFSVSVGLTRIAILKLEQARRKLESYANPRAHPRTRIN
jgi:hypothetical protein